MSNRNVTQSIVCWGVFAFVVASLGCQSNSIKEREAAVLAADRARMEALILADEGELYMVLHSSLNYIHSNGTVDTKNSLIDAVVTGRVDYRKIEPGERVVGIHGFMGVIDGPVHIEVAVGERVLELDSTYTAVYWWEGNRWQLGTYESRSIKFPKSAQ